MPNPKLIVESSGLDAQFRLIPDEKEEGQIDSDEDEDENGGEDDDDVARVEESATDVHENVTDNKDNNNLLEERQKGTENSNETFKSNGNQKNVTKAKKQPQISLFEIQSFLIALILPEPRLSTPPSWCRVLRCMRAPNVGIFLLDIADLDWIEDKGSKFTHAFRFEASPNWIEQLTIVPLSRRMQNMTTSLREFGTANERFEPNINAEPKISKTSLLLSPLQMIVDSYPMPNDENIKLLKSWYRPVSDESPMFAIDCEMCITDRSELARISIVDEELGIVYNKLVKPSRPITNYLTQYSGITEEMMEGVTTTLEDVHEFIAGELKGHSIFCGHSLNNDLAAIKIFHPYVIDTSVIYSRTGIRSYKPSLKSLAFELLGEKIQIKEDRGHDSLEDARTAMKLVKLKLVNGILFGDLVSQGIKYDSKTGVTHLPIDKFIERHKATKLSYRFLDTTPGARCLYVHDKQEPIGQDVKETISHLLEKNLAICVVLISSGECYVKF